MNHTIFENIEQIVKQNNFVKSSVFRRNHDHQNIEKIQQIDQSKIKTYKKCEKFEFEKFQSIYNSKIKFVFVEQYVDRQNSKIFVCIKIFNFYTCRRCFRNFRFNNELHEHVRCIHLKHRRRRRFNNQFFYIDCRLNQSWKKFWSKTLNHLSYKTRIIFDRTQSWKIFKSLNEKFDKLFIFLCVLLIDFLAMNFTFSFWQMTWLRKRNFFFFFVNICYSNYACYACKT